MEFTGGNSARQVLNRYEALIIDEAHERSLNIDFLLGYLKGSFDVGQILNSS